MVKEAITLSKTFFEVKVIYCPMSPWGDEFDQKVLNENPQILWINVGAHPIKNRFIYFFTRLRRKIWETVYALIGDFCNSALKSSVLYSQELAKEAMQHPADLYIGHNLGSIYAVIQAARKYNAKSSFDFEDFHRGEDFEESFHWNRTKLIEDKFVLKLNGATSASPLISKIYQKYYPKISFHTILNVFPFLDNKVFVNSSTERLLLFWFSQTIGKGRGLESFIKAAARVFPQPRLTLLGNCSMDVKKEFSTLAEKQGFDLNLLYFKTVLPETELISEASKHHIGICSEDPITINRDICLTNKLFTYMLGKNALLLSKTMAQIEFSEKNNGIGSLYDLKDINEITKSIQLYQDDRELLNLHRSNAFQIAKERLNWEKESEKLTFYYKELL
jgi:hypothetical protein